MDVRMVTLDPMWVASVRVTGESPERDAVAKICEWAAGKGFLAETARHPIYGFDNPPFGRRGGPRGYEVWIRIDREGDADQAVDLKRFDGGRYAVMRCVVHGDPMAEIPAAWGHLAEWVRAQGHKLGPHQSLEMHIDPAAAGSKFVIDLYCPVA